MAGPDDRDWLERNRVTLVVLTMVATIVLAVLFGIGLLEPIVPALGDPTWQYSRVFIAAVVVVVALFWMFAEAVGPAYMGALWLIAPRVPGIAALAVFLAYVVPPANHPVHLAAVGVGTYVAVILWITLAVLFRGAGCADASQGLVWSGLLQRICQLRSRIDGIDLSPDSPLIAVRTEACAQIGWAEAHLYEAPTAQHPRARSRAQTGVDWASGSAYLAVWQAVHRAEEAIVELEPTPAVVADALHDDLRLTDSTLTNAQSLRLSLQRAVTVLDPPAIDRYFTELQMIGPRRLTAPGPASTAASSTPIPPGARAVTASSTRSAAVDATGNGDERSEPHEPSIDEMVARGVVREVRFAINEFRDGAWDGLVRSRNRLLRTILVAGVVGLLLLDLAVLANVPTFNLISAVVFFLVGALVGLFNRLRIDAGSSRAVEDFGLFEARLLHTPLLSGLAALGGVFLTAVLPVFSNVVAPGASGATQVDLKPLTDVFNVSTNQVGLVVAAVFGLAPNSILAILKDQADRYRRDLAQSSATGSGDGATSSAG